MIILRKFNSGLKSKVFVYLYKVSDGKAVTDSQGLKSGLKLIAN